MESGIRLQHPEGSDSDRGPLIEYPCSRAIHLNVEFVTTAEFTLAFVRYANQYGVSSALYSDNTKSLVQSGSTIEQLLTSSEFEERFSIASITHQTISVHTAWYSAVLEKNN